MSCRVLLLCVCVSVTISALSDGDGYRRGHLFSQAPAQYYYYTPGRLRRRRKTLCRFVRVEDEALLLPFLKHAKGGADVELYTARGKFEQSDVTLDCGGKVALVVVLDIR